MPSPPSSACPPSCSTLARATRGGSPRKGVPFRADAHAFLASLCLSYSHLLLVLLLLPLWLLPLRRASSSSGSLSLSHSARSSSTTSLRNSWELQRQHPTNKIRLIRCLTSDHEDFRGALERRIHAG